MPQVYLHLFHQRYSYCFHKFPVVFCVGFPPSQNSPSPAAHITNRQPRVFTALVSVSVFVSVSLCMCVCVITRHAETPRLKFSKSSTPMFVQSYRYRQSQQAVSIEQVRCYIHRMSHNCNVCCVYYTVTPGICYVDLKRSTKDYHDSLVRSVCDVRIETVFYLVQRIRDWIGRKGVGLSSVHYTSTKNKGHTIGLVREAK